MSLGALDFGIIIDGAVIIVEFVAFKMLQKSERFKALTGTDYTSEKNVIAAKGASKMMNSAIFWTTYYFDSFYSYCLSFRG